MLLNHQLRAAGVPPGPHEVRRELGNDPDLPAETSHRVVYLADLMDHTPRAGHAPACAALVIDAAIHDRLHQAGTRITQAAEAGNSAGAFWQARQARREMDAARAHVRTGYLPRAPARSEG